MDSNQDNNRKCSVAEERLDSIAQTVQTSRVTSVCGQNTVKAADSCSLTDCVMETGQLVSNRGQLETPVKEVATSTNFYASKKVSKETEQPKYFGGMPGIKEDEESESVPKPADKDSSGATPCRIFLRHDSPTSGSEANKKYEENLKKFLKEKACLVMIKSRKKMEVSEKAIKSDGEISKIIGYRGNVTSISSALSQISLNRSSAPPTFNTVSRESPKIEEHLSTCFKTKNTFNAMSESSKITSASENQKPSVSDHTDDSSVVKNLDSSLSKSPEVFKVPISPTCIKRIHEESLKSKIDSPGTSKIKDDGAKTPVLQRPTNFNVKIRKTFYTFSPNTTGVLRQCQSLPNISRPQRREGKQRRSLILGQHARIVRSLFSNEPEPSTPKNKESAVLKTDTMGETTPASSVEESKRYSQEESSRTKETSNSASLVDRKSKICRKLCFSLPADDGSKKSPTAEKTEETPKGKPESPLKRKEFSSDLTERSSACVKKVRISTEKNESTSNEKLKNDSASEEKQNDDLKRSCSPGKKSLMKRKAKEDEGTSSSKTKSSSKIITE